MIKIGQVYKFDTRMIHNQLPGIPPVLLKLTVNQVDYNENILRFEPALYEVGYVDVGTWQIFDWFKFTLPAITDSVLRYPADFERFVSSGGAQLLEDASATAEDAAPVLR
jgi:hypothetical protein